MSNDSAGVEVG